MTRVTFHLDALGRAVGGKAEAAAMHRCTGSEAIR
jgi:hypothetical protein